MLFYNIILLFYMYIISPSGSPAFILNKISKILCVISSHLKFFPERPTLLEENGFCTVAGKSRGSRSRCRPALPPPAGPPSSGRSSLLRPAQRLRQPPCAPASYPPRISRASSYPLVSCTSPSALSRRSVCAGFPGPGFRADRLFYSWFASSLATGLPPFSPLLFHIICVCSPGSFKTFSLSLILSDLILMFLGVVFSVFILLGICRDSWICGLKVFIRFGNV